MNIVKETTTALQSVFPPAELGTFLEFSRKEKERHLTELTRIVSGIRLFNKNNGTGTSRGIEDLPAILNEAIKPSVIDIESERAKAQKLAEYYTAILRNENQEKTKDEEEKMRGTVLFCYFSFFVLFQYVCLTTYFIIYLVRIISCVHSEIAPLFSST